MRGLFLGRGWGRLLVVVVVVVGEGGLWEGGGLLVYGDARVYYVVCYGGMVVWRMLWLTGVVLYPINIHPCAFIQFMT